MKASKVKAEKIRDHIRNHIIIDLSNQLKDEVSSYPKLLVWRYVEQKVSDGIPRGFRTYIKRELL